MQLGEADPDAYLEAFMNGFDFVLLAMRGRLQESDLEPAERARIDAFLEDYARIPRAYRERRKPAVAEPLASMLPFRLEMAVLPSN